MNQKIKDGAAPEARGEARLQSISWPPRRAWVLGTSDSRHRVRALRCRRVGRDGRELGWLLQKPASGPASSSFPQITVLGTHRPQSRETKQTALGKNAPHHREKTHTTGRGATCTSGVGPVICTLAKAPPCTADASF